MDNKYIETLKEFVKRDRELRNYRIDSDYEQWCETHCVSIEKLLDEIDKLKRIIAIKDEYLDLIWAVGYDYDGYEKPKDLKQLVDELVGYAKKAKVNDDKSVIYGAVNKKMNILMEEINEKI